jgi:hypothetical protein
VERLAAVRGGKAVEVLGAQLHEGIVLDAGSGHHHARTHVVGLDNVVELLAPNVLQVARRAQVAEPEALRAVGKLVQDLG